MCSFVGILKSAKVHDYDELFYQIVNQAKGKFKLSAMDLAEIFGVSLPTVNRWLTGENYPHPTMRPAMYQTFINIAMHMIEEHDGEA